MTTLCAVIIETRPIPNLVDIIQKHMDFLPSETPLYIFYDKETEYLVDHFKEARCIPVFEMTIRKYNETLTDLNFWEIFYSFDKVFVFQSDSMILRKGIEYFYEYDYVGASWIWQLHGGNGGCSLRTTKVMKEICEKYPFNETLGNEDVYFCNIMNEKKIGKLAPRDVCMRFGTEGVFSLGTFSYHAIEKYLNEDECKEIKNQYLNWIEKII